MSKPYPQPLVWQLGTGGLECYEARIVTSWSEYVRGVIIAQNSHGYTAYVEYFKHGVPRQLWGKQIFSDREQATAWCEQEIARQYQG